MPLKDIALSISDVGKIMRIVKSIAVFARDMKSIMKAADRVILFT